MRNSSRSRLWALGLAAVSSLVAGCADQPIGGFDRPRFVADAAQAQTDLQFLPGSARLAHGEADRLSAFLRGLVLRPSDDIVLTFGPSGSTVLDRQRIAVVESAVSSARTAARVRVDDTRGFGRGADRGDIVLVQAMRYDVLVVDCSPLGYAATDTAYRQPPPPLGCSNEVNLAHMAASVRDLTNPRLLGPTPAALVGAPGSAQNSGDSNPMPSASR